jgi:hypothetical protein
MIVAAPAGIRSSLTANFDIIHNNDEIKTIKSETKTRVSQIHHGHHTRIQKKSLLDTIHVVSQKRLT